MFFIAGRAPLQSDETDKNLEYFWSGQRRGRRLIVVLTSNHSPLTYQTIGRFSLTVRKCATARLAVQLQAMITCEALASASSPRTRQAQVMALVGNCVDEQAHEECKEAQGSREYEDALYLAHAVHDISCQIGFRLALTK